MSKLYKYDVDIDHIVESDCLDIFLNSLKLHISSFAMYYKNEIWFTLMNKEEEVQTFVDNFDCGVADAELRIVYPEEPEMIIMQGEPTTSFNPRNKGLIWINEVTGKMFTCTSNDRNKNIWVASDNGDVIRPVPGADKFDYFEDGSATAFYKFNSNCLDVGGQYHGAEDGVSWPQGLEDNCAFSNDSGRITIKNLPFSNDSGAITVAGWVNWNGISGCMPFGFKRHAAYCYGGNIGFTTSAGDIQGADFSKYANKWVYLIMTFRDGEYGEMYYYGVPQPTTKLYKNIKSKYADLESTFNIFGWGRDKGYRKFGLIDRLRLFNRGLTPEEALQLSEAEMEFIKSINGDITWS